MTTTNDQHDQHVRDSVQYHAEQQAFFAEVEHQNWMDRMDAIHGPQDAGLDEYVALQQMEHLYQETGTWNADVWAEKGWW